MRHHSGPRAEATPGTFTVHEAWYTTPEGSVTMLVAVPFPYCTEARQVQEICAGVLGHACFEERQFAPTPKRIREALDNTRETYSGLFKRLPT